MASQRPKRGDKGTPKQTEESGVIPQAFNSTDNVTPIRKNIAGNQIVIIPGTGIYEVEDRKTPEDIRRKKEDSKIFLELKKELKKQTKDSKKQAKQQNKTAKDGFATDSSRKTDDKPNKSFLDKAKRVITGKDKGGKDPEAKTRKGAFGLSIEGGLRGMVKDLTSPFLDLPVISQLSDAVGVAINHTNTKSKLEAEATKKQLEANRAQQEIIKESLQGFADAGKQFELTFEEMTPGGLQTKTKTVEAHSEEEALGMLDITQKAKGIEPLRPDNDSAELGETLGQLLEEEQELESMLKDAHGVHSPGYLHDIVNLQTQVLDNSKKLLTKDADSKLKAKEDKNEARKNGLFAKRDKDNQKRNEEGGGGFFSSLLGMVTGIASIAALLKKPKLLFKHLLKKIPGAKALGAAWKLAFKDAGTAWAKLGSSIAKGLSGLGSLLSKGLSGLGSLLSKGSSKVATTLAKTVAASGGAAVADAVSSSGPGFWSRAWSKTKNIAGAAVGGVVKGAKAVGGAVSTGAKAVGGAVSGGAKALWSGAKIVGGLVKKGGKWVASKAGEVVLDPIKKMFKSGGGRMFGKLVKGVPILTTLLEAIFAHQDIKEIIANPDLTRAEKEQMVGKRAGGMIGAIMGTALGGMAGTAIPIPFVGTAIGAIGGAFVGEWLGGLIADVVGARPIGKVLMDHVYDKMPNKDDVSAVGGGGGGGGGSQFGGVSSSGQGANIPRAGLVTSGGSGIGPVMISSTPSSTTSGGILSSTNAGLHTNQSSNMGGGGGGGVAVNAPTTTTSNTTNNNIASGKGDSRMDEGAFNTERRDANNNSMF